MQPDIDEFFAKLELAGEDAVRAKYAQRAYGTDMRPLVELCRMAALATTVALLSVLIAALGYCSKA